MSEHLHLTGYRGTGKTSVAVIVAQSLGRPMIDLDDLIEQRSGRSIREIFDSGGESAFRELESQALFAIPPLPPAVISLGGGTILQEENRRWIREHGFCVWLDASAEVLAGRIGQDASTAARRPALTDLSELEEIRHLLGQRRPFYEEVADCRIDTSDKTTDQVAHEVLAAVQG